MPALITWDYLVQRSQSFEKEVRFPTVHNRIAQIARNSPEKQREIVEQARSVRIVACEKVRGLLSKFLEVKRSHGSEYEKTFYRTMKPDDLVERLMHKRPLVFMGGDDDYMLARPSRQSSGGFEKIGTDHEEDPLHLSDLLSYSEMAVSALFGVSVPTFFINSGGRYNSGQAAKEGDHELRGVYVGLVGARFEREQPPLMEHLHMVVSRYCTAQRGYGEAGAREHPDPQLQMWANFYGLPYFPSFDEVHDKPGLSSDFLKTRPDIYLNVKVYKQRLRMSIEPFLYDAHMRAAHAKKKAYCHVVGLGLGVWMLTEQQGTLMVEVYHEVLQSRDLTEISDIDFSFFPSDCVRLGGKANGEVLEVNGNKVRVHFSRRDPAERLNDSSKLLVAMYAWDSNAFPGNEYWIGHLDGSGDPAAACCSTIAELQNPMINPNIHAGNVLWAPNPPSKS